MNASLVFLEKAKNSCCQSPWRELALLALDVLTATVIARARTCRSRKSIHDMRVMLVTQPGGLFPSGSNIVSSSLSRQLHFREPFFALFTTLLILHVWKPFDNRLLVTNL